MSVGILLMTHEAVGHALISAARHVMPKLPLRVDAVEIPADADTDVMRSLTARHARALDQGDGVLVLADLYGATPCNIGLSLASLGVHLRCVSGLNLPMLLRVLNYADRPLDELVEIAASGGRGGIFIDHA
ncbi:PTS sugar transporter subunit IIA [Dyella ginsengisoli]|uniref:PTS sugar transporter subunit IIA n=1 Tax=Dyella ginsengisoli TaxID=363848 RepID=UPI000345CA88|nr:PTS fructose transporter subunit IIA [Dyella ginsengisoli]